MASSSPLRAIPRLLSFLVNVHSEHSPHFLWVSSLPLGLSLGCPAAPSGHDVAMARAMAWPCGLMHVGGKALPTPPLPPTGGAAGHALGGRSQGCVQCGANSCVFRAPPGTELVENPSRLPWD